MPGSLEKITAHRIAIIKPSALGDIVHSLPILTVLRQRFPSAHLSWIVNQSYADLLSGHPDLDEVIEFDRGAVRSPLKGPFRFIKFLREIRHQNFDLVIDLQGLLRTGLMVMASGGKNRIGLSSAREGAGRFYSHVLEAPTETMHAVDRYWRVADALGVGNIPKRFTIPINQEQDQWAGEQLEDCPKPWLMMNLGTRWETKRWPVGHFVELGVRAQERFGGTIVFVGGPEESRLVEEAVGHDSVLDRVNREEQKVKNGILTHGIVDLTGKTSLKQLAAVLSRADVMISNDSGPLHLAVALGRPVVAPFTCTSSLRTGPYNSPGAVETNVWCKASYRKQCSRMECMDELTPARLWPSLERILTQWQRRSA